MTTDRFCLRCHQPRRMHDIHGRCNSPIGFNEPINVIDYGQHVGAGDGCGTHIPKQITEADVRRILREELAAFVKATKEST